MYKQLFTALIVGLTVTLAACNNGDDDNDRYDPPAITGPATLANGIVGTAGIQPPGARVPRPFRAAAIRFGPPIDPGSYGGGRRTRRRQITDDVMTAIQSLSGQQRRPE